MKLPKGYGSAYKLKGRRRKPWIARITTEPDPLTGKQKRIAIGYYTTKKEALDALGKRAAMTFRDARYTWTFKDVFDLVYAEKEKTLGESRLSFFRASYKNYLNVFGDKVFSSITPQEYQRFFDALPLSNNSKQPIKACVTSMYKFAIANNIVDRNYCVVNLGDTSPTHKKHRFTDAEIAEIWKHEGELFADIVLFGIYTGFRPGAILIIETKNVHLEEGYIVGGIKTKAGRNRIVPINDKIMPIVKRYCDPENTYLFTLDGKKIRPDIYASRFENLVKNFEQRHTPHDTRVTCNSLMARAGVPDVPRKLIMGHAQKDVNDEVYTDVLLEELKEYINRI